MDKIVLIFVLISLNSVRGISQPFKLNFIIEIDSISTCTPRDKIDFQLRFEEIPLNVTEQEYPFYSLELRQAYQVDQLSLHLFYNDRQIEFPPLSFNTYENGHFKITLDTCKKNDCLYIFYRNDGVQFNSMDCTRDNLPKLKMEIINPIIYSADYLKYLNEWAQDENIPDSTREELLKSLKAGYSSLEKYYHSLSKNQ